MLPRLYLILFALWIFPTASFAVAIEVEVAERGENATEARMKAMTAAERLAMEKLLIEKIPGRGKETTKSLDDEAIAQMVQGYEIVKEKMTPNTYRGTIKVKFDDYAIEKLLGAPAGTTEKENEVAAAAASSASVLLLPVWFDEKGILLWETTNEWRNIINRTALQAEAGAWIVPFGDPTDLLVTDSTQIENASFAQLAPMAARYGAGSILVAIAKPGERVLDVELRHLTKAGEEKEVLSVPATDNVTLAEDLMGIAAEKLLIGTDRVAPAALTGTQQAALPERKKIPQLHHINLLLHLKQARDWAELNHRLHTIEGVEELQVVVADWRRMQMRMAYRGDPEDLGEDLAKAGLTVQQSADMLLVAIR